LHEFLTSKRYGNQNAVAQDFVAEFDPNGKETVGDIIKKIQNKSFTWAGTHAGQCTQVRCGYRGQDNL
jgi:hypothetical protein